MKSIRVAPELHQQGKATPFFDCVKSIYGRSDNFEDIQRHSKNASGIGTGVLTCPPKTDPGRMRESAEKESVR